MINTIDLHDLIAKRYLNCYKEYIDDETGLELEYNLLYRLNMCYEILEIIYDSINE